MSSHSSTKTCYQTSPCTPCTPHDMFSSSDSPMAVSSHDPKLRALSPIQLDHASLLSRTSAGPSRYLGWHRLIDLLYHRHIIVEDSCNNEKCRDHPHYRHLLTFFVTAKIRKSLNLILCHQFGPCFLDYTCPWTSMTIHVQKALTTKAGRKASGYGDITGCETPCRSLSKAMEWCL